MIGGTSTRLRLTVVDPSRAGAQVDVEVSTPAATPLRRVASALVGSVGHPGGAGRPSLFVDGDPVDDAVLGQPPLLDGVVLTVGRPGGQPGRGSGTCGGLTEVHVVGGPDAGARLALTGGVTLVGRGCEAAVRLADPDVSRVHAEIVVADGSVRVRDLGSTNGSTLADDPLGPGAAEWRPGSVLRVGSSLLALRILDGSVAGDAPAATVPDGKGHLLVNPAPRLLPAPDDGVVTFPEPPPDPATPRLPWPAVLLPLLLSVPLAWWLQQAVFLAFALLSPLVMIGQYLFDRRQRSGERAQAAARYAADVARARAELADRAGSELARLLLSHPDPATVAATAAGPTRRLWERRPGDDDEARLRLGLGTRPASTQVRGVPPADDPPSVLVDAPITVDLGDPAVGGVLGLAGPRRETLSLARSLVGQSVVAGSPHHLRVVVLTANGDPDDDWAWAARLPHASDHLPTAPDADAVLGGGETGPAGTGRRALPAPRALLVLDGAASLRRDPRVAGLLAQAGGRLHVLCLDEEAARLPAECGATVEVAAVGAEPGAVLTVRGGRPCPLAPDLVSPGWAESLARNLARLADATPAGRGAALPQRVRLVELLGPGDVDELAVAATWSARRAARAPASSAVVGVTSAGPWELDLARHGPHALVAGTTGAGKSALLTALVAGLAVAHPPDRLNLLLVDYKGGTAFGPLADLPHTAGVLTDLDEHLARRALSSLRAELRRREGLLRAAGAADVDGYDRSRGPTDPPMPRLVIVVDEFRVLAEELPDLLSGLVRVAVVGRSLGVHLVLATQRPAGVVTAEIRANVNLRIALRVRDRMDSEDVVEAPDAALLPPDRPGRGLFRVGGGPLVEFQAALATGRRPTEAEPIEVRRLRRDPVVATAWRHDAPPHLGQGVDCAATQGDPAPGLRPDDPDDLDALVAACGRAALRYGAEQARSPWLPPLPLVVRPSDVPALLVDNPGSDPGSDPDGDGLTLGVIDLPARQARARLRWAPPGDGHLAVVGAPGSGRTGVLRAIAGAASRATTPVHLHVIDATGGLTDLAALPRVGTVVPAADVVRAGRLLALLAERGRRRRAATSEPEVLLLVDGWEQLIDTWLPVEHGRLVDELVRLARDGTAAGVRIAISGGRSLLSGQLPGVLTERLLLRAADPGDLLLAGVPAASLPADLPPGRALQIRSGGLVTEAQVVLDDLADVRTARRDDEPSPLRLLPVPARVDVEALLVAAGAGPGGLAAVVDEGLVPVGIGGEDAAPVGPTATGPGWLVAGSPGSGRSTALACAARMLVAAGREVVVVGAPQSPAARSVSADRVVAPWSVRSDPGGLVALLDRHPGATLVVDDLSLLAESPSEDWILTRLDQPGCGPGGPGGWPTGPGPHVLAGCTPAQAAVAFRGLGARLRGTGTALLLAPVGPADGEAFGTRVPAVTGAPPGRALLVAAGGVRTVQVAGPRAPGAETGLPECAHG